MAKKTRKYLYLFVLQGNYGAGWDDLTELLNFVVIRPSLAAIMPDVLTARAL